MLTANLLLLVVAVLYTSHEDGSLVREDEAILNQVLVARIQHGIQHALIQQKVAHPLRYNDIHFVKWQHDLLHLALQQCDLVAHAVAIDNLPRLVDDGGHVHTDDVFCAGLDGEPNSTCVSACSRGLWGNGKSNMLRMAVPHPTSRTTLSLNRCPFWYIESR